MTSPFQTFFDLSLHTSVLQWDLLYCILKKKVLGKGTKFCFKFYFSSTSRLKQVTDIFESDTSMLKCFNLKHCTTFLRVCCSQIKINVCWNWRKKTTVKGHVMPGLHAICASTVIVKIYLTCHLNVTSVHVPSSIFMKKKCFWNMFSCSQS